MADKMTESQRHECMSHIRSKDTVPEVVLRRELFRRGFRFRKNVRSLPGTPDIVLPKYHTCIFVNGCFWRSKSKCRFKGTAEQMRTAEVHRRALAAWRTLPHSMQLKWNEYAREVPQHRPPFDGRGHITGHNLFVSAYHGFAQMGNEHVPEPVKWMQFPVFAMQYAGCESATGDSLKLRFRLTLPDAESPERYRALAKIQVGKPGCGKDSGKMRNVLSESVSCGEVSEIAFHVSYAGISASPFQNYMRYLLLGTETGYRSQYKTLSTLASCIAAEE